MGPCEAASSSVSTSAVPSGDGPVATDTAPEHQPAPPNRVTLPGPAVPAETLLAPGLTFATMTKRDEKPHLDRAPRAHSPPESHRWFTPLGKLSCRVRQPCGYNSLVRSIRVPGPLGREPPLRSECADMHYVQRRAGRCNLHIETRSRTVQLLVLIRAAH